MFWTKISGLNLYLHPDAIAEHLLKNGFTQKFEHEEAITKIANAAGIGFVRAKMHSFIDHNGLFGATEVGKVGLCVDFVEGTPQAEREEITGLVDALVSPSKISYFAVEPNGNRYDTTYQRPAKKEKKSAVCVPKV